MTDVQIVTRGLPASAEDWVRVLNTPEDALPQLTEKDRSYARTIQYRDFEYRRRLALRRFARERELSEAESLAQELRSLLSELGPGYGLFSIEKRGGESGWHVLVRTPAGSEATAVRDVHFDESILGEDTDGTGRLPLITAAYLREHLFHALGREDALRVAN